MALPFVGVCLYVCDSGDEIQDLMHASKDPTIELHPGPGVYIQRQSPSGILIRYARTLYLNSLKAQKQPIKVKLHIIPRIISYKILDNLK